VDNTFVNIMMAGMNSAKPYGKSFVFTYEHQVLEENIQSLQKQKALLIQQRDLAVKQQHPFTVSQMRSYGNPAASIKASPKKQVKGM
ncbi:hypothetical protein STEG23_012494, partial [Scotinomys teguina]